MTRLTVVHVVESFGAGVLSAMTDYVRATPEIEHHLVRRVRRGEYSPDGELELFTTVHELRQGHWAAWRDLRVHLAALRPDVIHAHSSYAGAYARLAARSSARTRTVYTPHCYAFERLDVRGSQRAAFRMLEWLLSWNTDVIAGCSRRELQLARGGHAARGAVYVPNVIPEQVQVTRGERRSGPPRVASLGRLSSQKDPGFFAQTVAALRVTHPDLEATWVGGGDAARAAELEAAGVTVTGWLPRSAARRLVGSSDVYVHTAAWEGFPLAVLEAHAAGVPVAARRIPAMTGGPRDAMADTPAGVAAVVTEALSRPDGTADLHASWAAFLADNTPAVQRARLLECYRA